MHRLTHTLTHTYSHVRTDRDIPYPYPSPFSPSVQGEYGHRVPTHAFIIWFSLVAPAARIESKYGCCMARTAEIRLAGS